MARSRLPAPLHRAAFLRQLGAPLALGLLGSLTSSCGAPVVPPGEPTRLGPGQGLALVYLWDESCKPTPAEPSPQDPVPTCDFSGSNIVMSRLVGQNGEKDRYTEQLDFEPGYQLLVLPIGTWKFLRLEWDFGSDFADFNDRRHQFVVKPDVVSDWGVIGLERMNKKSFRFVREDSKPGDAQRYLSKNWPTMKTKVISGVAGPGDRVSSTEP